MLLLGLNSLGLFFYWGEIQLCKIKAEEYSDSDNEIPGKSFIIFISIKYIERINNNEILANGKLYDIVKTEINNGITFYYTLSDEDEDNYVQGLTDWEKYNAQEKSLPGKTINLQLTKYFTVEEYNHYVATCSPSLRNDMKTASDSVSYISPFINIFSPPPNNLLS